jgi:oxygen-independent coproporphyrinogen III oxidase
MHAPRRFEKRLTEVYVYPEICKYQDAIADVHDYMSFLDGDPPDAGFMFYVHIPFCESLCYFCNYFKEVLRPGAYDERKQFFDAYVREIETFARARYLAGRPVRAVQFGGGTPSAVEPEFIAQIMDAIRKHFTCRFEMVSMEGNVTSLQDVDKLRAFKSAGIERISFGVQTVNERVRKMLHLKATVADIYRAVEALNHVGFEDYSHDLMFNLPDQSMDDVERDLETVDREIRPTYLDCYNLNVMPNTMFSDALQRDTYTRDAPSDDKEVRMMREIVTLTRALGYRQVMSNIFTKRREHCVLTLGMQLDGSESVGIGPSARGFVAGRGWRNIPSVDGYVERVASGGYSALGGNVATPEELSERHLVMLGNFGVVRKADVPTLDQFQPQLDFLYHEGYAVDEGDTIRLTDEGWIWPGNVSELFFNRTQRLRRNRSMLQAFKNKENPYNQDRMGVSASLYRNRSQAAAARATGA